MLPIAHTASALLANRLIGFDKGLGPALAGALVPDAIDKGLAWVLGVTPSGRYIAHTPLAVLTLASVASAFVGRKKAAAFATAYMVHLVADLWDHGHVPWLMPFKHYEERAERWEVKVTQGDLMLEAVGLGYLLVTAVRQRR